MSNQSRPNPVEPDGKGAVDAAAPDEEARPNTSAAADPEAGEVGVDQLKTIVEALQSELEAKEAQLAEKHDALLRNMAETENVRRRLEREKDETAKYAIAKFAKDVLTIGDNFERAIDAVPPDAVASDPTLKSLYEGIVVAQRDYRSMLERHGVKVINSTGQPFNPHYHQAVTELENTEVPAGTVLQVYQSGYLIDDRCLRPAMVVVSRGGPKPPKASATAEGQNSGTGEARADNQMPDEPAGQASDDASSSGS